MGYSHAEFIVYSTLRSAPIIFFAFLMLRDRARRSQKLAAVCFTLMGVSWVALSYAGARIMHNVKIGAIVEIMQSIILVTLLLIAIKDHVGKLLFVFFMLYTIGGLTSLTGKYIEIKWNRELAYRGYCWTASVTIVLAVVIIFIPFGLAIYKDIVSILGKEGESTVWKYCWLVPAAFYLFWMQNLYHSGSSLECASHLTNVLYLLAIDAASFLIYHMIIRMVLEHNKLLEVRAVNQTLAVQVMEYNDLSKRIRDARKTKHDLRHHIAILESIADNRDEEGLRRYIDEFRKIHRLDEPIAFCENMTANAVLTYFSHLAVNQGTEFRAEFSLPEEIGIGKSDLAVLLGNLLENAVDACAKQDYEHNLVTIRGGLRSDGVVAFTVDNTCLTVPVQNSKGRYMSTKHDGEGLGTESVRDIVARYNGLVNFSYEPGMFCVSVMMYVHNKMDADASESI